MADTYVAAESNEPDSQNNTLREYDGKRCRVYLVNGHCLVGEVRFDNNTWLTISRNSKDSCKVNINQVITIGEYA